MKKNRAISFIQLPLVNHAYDYIQGNIEYASAAIAGFVKTQVDKDIKLHILPRNLLQYGSDSLIVDHIINNPPDILAFTCFLWNIERSLEIARQIKEKKGNIQIIFGGSEIHPGSIALSELREYVDYFVIGEGEWFFGNLLSGKSVDTYVAIIQNNRVVIQPDDKRIPAYMLYEPFTGKMLSPMDDGSMFFEMTRGCPYRCQYCLYSKNYSGIRELSFEILVKALAGDGVTENLKELYILSPSFNTMAHFRERLEVLANLGHGIRLHSEMRAENIDGRLAELLYRAGFRSMEVGLQTMNMSSLESVGRRGDPKKEIEGMLHLKKAGVDLKIGLIPGLPGDTKESFLGTVDILMNRGFKENIELYPLMILPGTRIRDKAIIEKINFAKKPPYYYNYGWGTSFEDIRHITKYVEETTGYSHVLQKLPDFTGNEQGEYCNGVRFNGGDVESWNYAIYEPYVETNVFNFYIESRSTEIIYPGLPALMKDFPPHQLSNIILFNDDILDERRIIDLLAQHDRDDLLRRIYIFNEWKDGLNVHLYQVFGMIENYLKAKKQHEIITPVFKIEKGNYRAISSICDYEDNVLISKGAFRFVKRDIKKFADAPEHVAFEDIKEQREFYDMIGYDYLEIPLTFRVVAL